MIPCELLSQIVTLVCHFVRGRVGGGGDQDLGELVRNFVERWLVDRSNPGDIDAAGAAKLCRSCERLAHVVAALLREEQGRA